MAKYIQDMTFEEIVDRASEIELTSLITGDGNIRSRMWRIAEMVAHWQHERLKAEGKLK